MQMRGRMMGRVRALCLYSSSEFVRFEESERNHLCIHSCKRFRGLSQRKQVDFYRWGLGKGMAGAHRRMVSEVVEEGLIGEMKKDWYSIQVLSAGSWSFPPALWWVVWVVSRLPHTLKSKGNQGSTDSPFDRRLGSLFWKERFLVWGSLEKKYCETYFLSVWISAELELSSIDAFNRLSSSSFNWIFVLYKSKHPKSGLSGRHNEDRTITVLMKLQQDS